MFSGATPSQTLIPGLQWLNRQAFVTSEDAAGQINQGMGMDDTTISMFVAGAVFGSKPFNEHPQVPFVYDQLRQHALRSGIFVQQAGKGSRPFADDVWDQWDFAMEQALRKSKSPSEQALALDDAAIRMASAAWKKGTFDLFVVYLAGLDHYVHAYGVEAGRTYFEQHLHEKINRIVNDLSARNLLDSTVFAVFADHG